MKKIFNNSKGFSLVQMMILAAVIAAMGVVGVKISKQANKTSAKSQFDYDITLATNEISEILSDPTVCQTVFGSTANPSSINGKYYTRASGMAPLDTGYKNSHFNVDSYTLSGTAPSGVLTIHFENPNVSKSSGNYATLAKQIEIYYQGSPGTVSTCRSLSKIEDTDIWLRARPTSNIYYDSNFVGIFTTDPQFRLDVVGEISTTTYARAAAFYATSDKKLKTNIRPINSSLENLNSLKGITYDWNETAFRNGIKDESRQIGLFAQDVEKIFPEAVKNSKVGFKAVNYQALVGPIVEGVKTLTNQNKKENSELKRLREENEEMKAWVCSQDQSAPFCN
jgi:hypothetical protein